MNFLLKNEFYEVTVSGIGAEMISIKNMSGRELVWQPLATSGWQYRTPFLFPFCSRLLDNKYSYGGKEYSMDMHGFIRTVDMTPLAVSETELTLRSVSARPDIYPFEYSFTVTYRLLGRTIRMEIEVENLDSKELPYMFGWHPGFVLPDERKRPIEDYAVKFNQADDLRLLPKCERPHGIPYNAPDNCYHFEAQPLDNTVIFRGQGCEALLFAENCPHTIEMRFSENMPYFCLWRGNSSTSDYVCLEPWADMVIDASVHEDLETKLMTRLAPGEKNNYFCEISFT